MAPTPPPLAADEVHVTLDRGARRLARDVIVGGAPARLFRLGPRGVAAVDAWAAGRSAPPWSAALARRLVAAGAAHPRHRPVLRDAASITVVVPVHDDPVGRQATAAAEPGAVVVDDAEGRGPAWARNIGARQTSTDVVAFLDAGCVPQPGWLEALLGHFANPDVAAVSPRVLSAPGPSLRERYEARRSPLDMGPEPSPVRPRSRVPYVPTAALLVRRRALDDIGGFDEAIRYGEDVDLVWRLVDAGWVVRYEPAATVVHPPRPTWWRWAVQRYAYGTSAAPLARRHGQAVAPAVIPPLSVPWLLAAASGHPALALVAAGTTVVLTTARLGGVPLVGAATLAVRGQLAVGRSVVGALRRPWSPLLVVLALRWRRARRLAVAVAVVPALAEWWRGRPQVDPVRWLALRFADDLAYGLGVWAGCLRLRSARALVPTNR